MPVTHGRRRELNLAAIDATLVAWDLNGYRKLPSAAEKTANVCAAVSFKDVASSEASMKLGEREIVCLAVDVASANFIYCTLSVVTINSGNQLT